VARGFSVTPIWCSDLLGNSQWTQNCIEDHHWIADRLYYWCGGIDGVGHRPILIKT
jgi:hypothetical protein